MKIPRNFHLNPKLVKLLEREAEKTGLTQTKILERALDAFLALKKAA